jgi:chemotaxis protein methyltransferase CheR
MHELGCHTMHDYLTILDINPVIRNDAEQLLTVSISRFFRDRHLWKILEETIIPNVISQYGESVQVWSAGCALGQEAYSFTILWLILGEKLDQLPQLRVWATDSNPDYLNKAREGIYVRSALREMPKTIIENYLCPSEDKTTYTVIDKAKEGIQWEIYNLIKEPAPAKQFQIIFLRNNLLTYYEQKIKEPAFRKILKRLTHGGFLIIGSHEKLPFETSELEPLEGSSYIFRKV